MKDFFKPEDFKAIVSLFDMGNLSKLPKVQAAEIANKKFNALIESWPVVHFCSENAIGELEGSAGLIIGKKEQGDTHIARLAFIEEIKEELCVHAPMPILAYGYGYISFDTSKCAKCGVELQATWSPKC